MSVSDLRTQARSTIVQELRRFMIGPAHGSEETLNAGSFIVNADGTNRSYLEQSPVDFYHTGMLWPPSTEIDEEEDDQDDQGNEVDAGAGDSVMVLANISQQSAMGLTAQVTRADVEIEATAEFGVYTLLTSDGPVPESASKSGVTGEDDQNTGKTKIRKPLIWKRSQHVLKAHFTPESLPESKASVVAESGKVELRVRRRRFGGLFFLTASVVSRRAAARPELGGEDPRVYQVRLSLKSMDGTTVFVESPNTARRRDSDFWQQELLYREIRQFAVGHGVSVTWDTRMSNVWQVATEWIPEAEVSKASARIPSFPDEIRLEDLAVRCGTEPELSEN